MDPVANIKRQRELATAIFDQFDQAGMPADELPCPSAQEVAQYALELAELVQALDGWRRTGGFDPYLKQSPHASERGLHEPPIPLGELRDRLEADAPSGDHGTLDDALQRAMELRTELATINFHGLAEAQLPIVSDAIDGTATVIQRIEDAMAIDDDLHPEENDWPGIDDDRYHDWRLEVANGDTRLGYDEWLRHTDEAENA